MPLGSYARSPGFFGMRADRPGRPSWDDTGVVGDREIFPVKVCHCIRRASPRKYDPCLLRPRHERGCPKPLLGAI